MTGEDIDEWLDSWIEAHHQSWGEPSQAVEACLADAEKSGISPRDLNDAANGDLETYLQEEAEAIAEASDEAPEGF